MSRILKPLLLFVLVTFVIWVAVLWQWEKTHRDMTVTDIVLYLGVLPVLVFGLLVALRWAWRSAGERASAAAQAAAAAAASPAGAAATPAQAQEAAARHTTVKVLATFVASPTGRAASDILDAAAEGTPRPDLDAELKDEDGMPVMCARIAELQTQDLDDQIEPIVTATRSQQAAWADARMSTHAVRALCAMQQPLQRSIDALRPWEDRFSAADSTSMVRVLVGWPADWTPFEQAVALAWVRLLMTEHAGPCIAASRFAFEAQPGTGEQLWIKADQLLQVLARDKREDVLLVAACHSGISDAAVTELAKQRRLFSAATHPKGLMPGEAAAALLLAPVQWPKSPDDDTPPVHLHRPAVAKRDKSIEAGGRITADCLRETLTQALAASQLDASHVGSLVCDADQHSARSTELFGTTLDMLAHLDPTEDMRLIGVGNGHTGVASTLLVVAAAAERARSVDKPTVALTLGDAFMRLALLVRPQAPTVS
ncbi:hypothetical protein [Piscinibacter terrae]|uniref:hypothetical protein n=1 Tax=Piscinibacter terrae TaxID=2496871 RepID=UPI000F5AEF7F|nr:hypothetical protein [Albitalea terrae]